jgi:hypothetical protein
VHKVILAIVGVAAVAALWAGCGGGSDDSNGSTTESTPSLTKAQFVKKADAICAERKKKWKAKVASAREELSEKDGSLNEDKADELVVSVLVPLMEEELENLEALGVPAGDEEAVSKMWEARSGAVEEIERGGTAAVSSSKSLTSFATQAREYGVQCPL